MQAVHRTLLTPAGDNLRHRDSGRKLKLGRGPQDGACTRLPGARSSIADPATWRRAGNDSSPRGAPPDTKAASTSASSPTRPEPERGRVNIMLVDDDGSDAADQIAAKVEQWTAEGYCVLVATAFDRIEGGGRDWNDLLQSDGPARGARSARRADPADRADLDAPADCHDRRSPRGDTGSDRRSLRRSRPAALAAYRRYERRQNALGDPDIRPPRSRAPSRARRLHPRLQDGTQRIAARRGTYRRQCRLAVAACPLSRRDARACRSNARVRPLARPERCARRRIRPAARSRQVRTAACTEQELRILTDPAGAPMPTAACGVDLLGPHCPQRGNCAHWIRRSRCGTPRRWSA